LDGVWNAVDPPGHLGLVLPGLGGPFYPPGTQPGDYLSFYASRFDAVEVDSTFYATASARTVAGWAGRTPDHFRFSVKTPRTPTRE
jgi:uncharacterized protein YecE (DUF72 family)